MSVKQRARITDLIFDFPLLNPASLQLVRNTVKLVEYRRAEKSSKKWFGFRLSSSESCLATTGLKYIETGRISEVLPK